MSLYVVKTFKETPPLITDVMDEDTVLSFKGKSLPEGVTPQDVVSAR